MPLVKIHMPTIAHQSTLRGKDYFVAVASACQSTHGDVAMIDEDEFIRIIESFPEPNQAKHVEDFRPATPSRCVDQKGILIPGSPCWNQMKAKGFNLRPKTR